MNTESIKQIIESLEKNGGMALDAMAAYKLASAWGDLIIAIAVLPIALFCLFKSIKIAEESESETSEKVGIAGVIAPGVAGGVSALFIMVGLILMPSIIATIKNPKGAAIYSLLNK